jgi:hypothetical protein
MFIYIRFREDARSGVVALKEPKTTVSVCTPIIGTAVGRGRGEVIPRKLPDVSFCTECEFWALSAN